jgi:hypothetical protein
MGMVVAVARDGLAVGAEVRIVANRTLVAHTLDIRLILLVFAKRTVTVDAVVARASRDRLGQRLIDWHKTVARVNVLHAQDTLRAVIPVGAVQALVANTIDELGMLVEGQNLIKCTRTFSQPSQTAE